MELVHILNDLSVAGYWGLALFAIVIVGAWIDSLDIKVYSVNVMGRYKPYGLVYAQSIFEKKSYKLMKEAKKRYPKAHVIASYHNMLAYFSPLQKVVYAIFWVAMVFALCSAICSIGKALFKTVILLNG